MWRHEAAQPIWAGVVWGRLGRGELAWQAFDRVRLPALQPWIAAERGRILRELGLHASAEALEWPALLTATDSLDIVMLRLSLAADAVGLGDVDRATRRLASARDALAEAAVEIESAAEAAPSRATPVPAARLARQRLRLAWVATEVAWLSATSPSLVGLPAWDDARAEPVMPVDHRWGSTFHTAKGLLFGGVARGDVRLLEAAVHVAPPGLLWAIHLARADRGRPCAEAAARRAWQRVVPPPAFDAEVRSGPTAARFSTP